MRMGQCSTAAFHLRHVSFLTYQTTTEIGRPGLPYPPGTPLSSPLLRSAPSQIDSEERNHKIGQPGNSPTAQKTAPTFLKLKDENFVPPIAPLPGEFLLPVPPASLLVPPRPCLITHPLVRSRLSAAKKPGASTLLISQDLKPAVELALPYVTQ